MLRVVAIDDSPFILRMLKDWLSSEPDIEVVGVGKDGDEAIRLAKELKPDVMTLDVEMPRRDGISALEEIMKSSPLPVVMVSSVTTVGAKLTLRALELGAVDFVTKPQGGASLKFVQAKEELIAKVRAAKTARLHSKTVPVAQVEAVKGKTDKIVVLASSTGGPRALVCLWRALPKGFPAPILLVQHMPAGFTTSLAQRLDSVGTVPCKEASESDRVTPGLALLAPGDQHMIVSKNGSIVLTSDPTVHGVRPAADVLFASVSKVYGDRIVGAVLTGMGKDGAEGSVLIRKAGGLMFGESNESATIYGMPKAALDAGGIDAEFPLSEMARAIVSKLRRRDKGAA